MKKIPSILVCLILLTQQAVASNKHLSQSGGGSYSKKSPKQITSEAGLNIPQWGVAIDAVYDNRLDSLIPGYKILNVILSNRGASSIFLDPRKDKWFIVDNIGKTYNAITHLRLVNEKLWSSLPRGLREKIEYPQTLRVGNSAKIDLFFPTGISLQNFREIGWMSSHFKKEFNIISAVEKNLEDDHNEPLPNTPTYKQSKQKYDQLDPLLQKDRPDVDYKIKADEPLDNPPPEIRNIPDL